MNASASIYGHRSRLTRNLSIAKGTDIKSMPKSNAFDTADIKRRLHLYRSHIDL